MTTEKRKCVSDLVKLYESITNNSMRLVSNTDRLQIKSGKTRTTNSTAGLNIVTRTCTEKHLNRPLKSLHDKSICCKKEMQSYLTINGCVDSKSVGERFQQSIIRSNNAVNQLSQNLKFWEQVEFRQPENNCKITQAGEKEAVNIIENINENKNIIKSKKMKETINNVKAEGSNEISFIKELKIDNEQTLKHLDGSILDSLNIESNKSQLDMAMETRQHESGRTLTGQLLLKGDNQKNIGISTLKDVDHFPTKSNIDDIHSKSKQKCFENTRLGAKIDKEAILPTQSNTYVSTIAYKDEVEKSNSGILPQENCLLSHDLVRDNRLGKKIKVTGTGILNEMECAINTPSTVQNSINVDDALFDEKRKGEPPFSARTFHRSLLIHSSQEFVAFPIEGNNHDQVPDKTEIINKQNKKPLINKIIGKTPSVDEVALIDIKSQNVCAQNVAIPLKKTLMSKNYTRANTTAIKIVNKIKRGKSLFQKLLEIFSWRPCCNSTIENAERVNSKIYMLINNIYKTCHNEPHLFCRPCPGENYKTLLDKIRGREDVDFQEFTAVEKVAALKMYLKEDLDGLLNIKTTKVIFEGLLTMGAAGEETLQNHGKFLIAKDRLVLLYKILTMFVEISDNFYRTRCWYDDLVLVLIPYLFPANGISGVVSKDLLRAGRLICKPYDLYRVERVLISK